MLSQIKRTRCCSSSMAEMPDTAVPKSLGRRLGMSWTGAGAIAALLVPKCPLCWMVVAGSISAAARLHWIAVGCIAAAITYGLMTLWRTRTC